MSPFDAARYARLLEGLEITVMSFRKALEADLTSRLDADYFQKQFVQLRKIASAWDRLDSHTSSVVCGPFGSNLLNDNYVENGIPMVRPFNLRDVRVDSGDVATLDPQFVENAGLKTFGPGAVMFARVGDIGAGINRYKNATISPNIIAAEMRPSIIPGYVAVFANTHYGKMQLAAGMKVVAQPTISTDSIRSLRIPLLSLTLQNEVARVLNSAIVTQDEGATALAVGERTLLSMLGLDVWSAPEPLSYVLKSSEAFASGRLDAQHFQPRYKALTDFIDATGQGSQLGNWLTMNQRGKQPVYGDEGLPVVNSKHVLRGEVRLDDENRKATSDEDTLLIQHGDVLMNGTGVGTIGRTAPYLHTGPAIPDNHITILRPKPGLDAVYLAVFLNSMAGQWQVEQRLRGSSGQLELYPNDIANFKVWMAPAQVQADIRRSVEKSHQQKQRAFQLLEAAKRAVEIAIEDSEAAAIQYIREVI